MSEVSAVHTGRTPSLPYLPALDGLRGVAVLAVLASHWIPKANRFGHVGLAGVYVFFVLSGFLITSILLDARDARDAGTLTLGAALRSFFGRRVLRIFPAYYFALIASVLVWPRMFSADFPWNVAYLGNMHALLLGKTTSINHFWSLAVEEQFYLFWPFVVMLVPRRDLLKVVALAVAISPAWRCAAIAMGWRHIVYTYPVWSNLDSIGLGALLAVGRRGEQGERGHWGSWIVRAGQLGAVLWATCAVSTYAYLGTFRLTRPGWVYAAIFIVYPLAVSLVGAYVVARVASASEEGGDSRSVLAKILGWRPLRAVGVVSYGVYVYHFFVQGLVDIGSGRYLVAPLPPLLRLVVLFGATLAVAAVSWFALERPTRAWGRRSPRPSEA